MDTATKEIEFKKTHFVSAAGTELPKKSIFTEKCNRREWFPKLFKAGMAIYVGLMTGLGLTGCKKCKCDKEEPPVCPVCPDPNDPDPNDPDPKDPEPEKPDDKRSDEDVYQTLLSLVSSSTGDEDFNDALAKLSKKIEDNIISKYGVGKETDVYGVMIKGSNGKVNLFSNLRIDVSSTNKCKEAVVEKGLGPIIQEDFCEFFHRIKRVCPDESTVEQK